MSQPHSRSTSSFIPPSLQHPHNDPSTSSTNENEDNNQHQHQTLFPNATFIGEMAKTYNQRTGGCNILLARHLISLTASSLPHLDNQPTKDSTDSSTLRILDNACGPLVLTKECLATPSIVKKGGYSNIHISAVDLSPDFIAYNRELLASASSPVAKFNHNPSSPSSSSSSSPFGKAPTVQIDTAIMDGTSLSFPTSTFHLAFTSLALFAFSDPVQGARELHRVLKPGGITAATTWKSVGWLPLLHEVESRLFPLPSSSSPSSSSSVPKEEEEKQEEGKTTFPFLDPWRVPGKLTSVLKAGGFSRVEESEVEAIAWWESVEECAYWISETLSLMIGQAEGGRRWGKGKGDKEGMREGFRGVLEKGEDGEEVVVRGEGGRVGVKMVAFVGVGWK